MKIQSNVYMGLVLLMFISMGAGCASTRQTTTTQTTVQESAQVEPTSTEPKTTVVEKSTTTTEATPEHTGILGGIFHVIGSVIALPFILIGGLLRMIF